MFSFYKGGIKQNKPISTISIERALELIRSDKYKDAVLKIRSTQDKDVRSVLKSYLDYCTFSGEFSPVRKVENLKKHSGLITIDFDNVENLDVKTMFLYQDIFTHLGFISPSGNGIKLVVKIDTKKHLESFQALESYYQEKYGLKIDKSGKDVCRVCFLSYDENAYYNANSEIFHCQLEPSAKVEDKPQKTKAEKPQQTAQPANDVEAHIALVVDRIVSHNMDITGNYSEEWLLIGMSMATIGEAGREYFHKISQFNEKYDHKATDDKFTELLKTSKFTNPAKFFSICKDYGIDVSKRGLSKQNESTAKEKTTIKKNTDDDEDTYEALFSPVFYNTFYHTIRVKSGRNSTQVSDNFLIYIKYQTKDENEEITWVLEVKRKDNTPIFIELTHDEFNSASKLKSKLTAESLSLKITDSQLSEIHGYLFTKTSYKKAVKIIRYGYFPQADTFFFSNVAVSQGQKYTPDTFGMVAVNQHIVSFPKVKESKKKRFELTNTAVSFNQLWQTYATAHEHERAFIPICFYLFSLFRDLAITQKNFSPILYLKGPAGTGKSAMVRLLTSTFGRKQEGVNLKSKNTEAALIKLMSQASNQIIWFDEFYNGMPNEGLMQAAYDNDGYHKSTSNNEGIETDSVSIHSALALTSNYIPENPIFFSRCIFIPIPSPEKSEEQRKAFYQLEEWQDAGLGCVTVEMLQYRSILIANDNMAVASKQLYDAFRAYFHGKNIPERLLANMAQVMSVGLVLQTAGKIQLTEVIGSDADILAEFVHIGTACIERQHRIMSETKAVAEFFEIVQSLYEQWKIHPELHFLLKGDEIRFNFPKLYNLFSAEYRRIFQKQVPDRSTLQDEIAAIAETTWEELQKSIRFKNDEEGNHPTNSIPIKGSFSVDYAKLTALFGLNLRSRKNIY